MSLLLIVEKLWRYKFLTIPIVIAVMAGAFYQVALTPSVYEASTSYILVNPPSPPTADQIAQNPGLARGASNPYTRYSDQSIIVQILSARLNSDETREKLLRQGADRRYQVAPDVTFGFTAPVVQIVGLSATPEGAKKTATVVGTALADELTQMQAVEGVARTYRISAQRIVDVGNAHMKASGKLRGMVGVLALGTVMLFLVVSVMDAITTLRARRSQPPADGVELTLAGPPPVPLDAAHNGHGLAPAHSASPPPPPLASRPGPSAWDGPVGAGPTPISGRPARLPARAQGHGHE